MKHCFVHQTTDSDPSRKQVRNEKQKNETYNCPSLLMRGSLQAETQGKRNQRECSHFSELKLKWAEFGQNGMTRIYGAE